MSKIMIVIIKLKKNNRRLFSVLYYVLLFITLFSHQLIAQTPLSLGDAIGKALENNYDLAVSKAQLDISKQRNSWGYSGALPSLNFGSSAMFRNDNDISATIITSSADLSWTLFNGFRVRFTKEKYDYLERISEGSASLVVENTMQAIILGYYSVLVENERLNVLQLNAKLSNDRYNYIQNRVDMGSGSQYELLQAQTSFLSDKAEVISQEMVLRNEKRMLSYLMADKNFVDYSFVDSLTFIPENYSLSVLIDKLLNDNQRIKNQYLNLEMLRVNKSLAQSSRYPSLRLNAHGEYVLAPESVNERAIVNNRNDTYSYYGGLVLNYTLFDGTKISRNVKIAAIEQSVGNIEMEQMKHELTNQLSNLFDLYEVRKELMSVTKENMDASKLNLTISSDKYKNGTLTSFEYRNVQQAYLDAAFSHINSVYNVLETHVDLLRLTGGLINYSIKN
ncbi:MAG: TolC family protein [Marinilabiliaceae bacterium]|nr:TolC family protein [Marinilabiliaceae bacterium]